MQIELSPEEARILREIAEIDLSDLRMEIADTESQPLREQLKTRQAVLEKPVSSLPAG